MLTGKHEIQALARKLKVRHDWHEPDEQNLTVEMVDGSFDNAMCDETEAHVVIKQGGKEIAKVNVALLLAWACGTHS